MRRDIYKEGKNKWIAILMIPALILGLSVGVSPAVKSRAETTADGSGAALSEAIEIAEPELPIGGVNESIGILMPAEDEMDTGDGEKSEVQTSDGRGVGSSKIRNSASSQEYPEFLAAGAGTYAYDLLTESEKTAYDKIVAGLQAVVTENVTLTYDSTYNCYMLEDIEVNNLSTVKELTNVWTCVKGDHPEFYWIDNLYYYYALNDVPISICPTVAEEYASDSDRDAMDAKIQTVVADYKNAVSGETDVYEQVRLIHNKICNAIDYAYVSGKPDSSTKAHSIAGVFSGYGAVCEGYAKAFAFLLNSLDIPQVYVVGDGLSGSEWGGHAWNVVSFDGGDTYYDMDVTWDDNKSSSTVPIIYNYFAPKHSLFYKNHVEDDSTTEEWQYSLPTRGDDNEMSYYHHYGLDLYQYNSSKWLEQTKAACALSKDDDFFVMMWKSNIENYLQAISLYGSYRVMECSVYSDDTNGTMSLVFFTKNQSVSTPLTEVSLSDHELSVEKGDTADLSIFSVTPSSTDDYLTFHSTDVSVFTVSKYYDKATESDSLTVTAKKAGTAFLIVKNSAGTILQKCPVHVTKNGTYDISFFKENDTYPTVSGKAFAGWFEDEDCETALSKEETAGFAYAKFVDGILLSTKAQSCYVERETVSSYNSAVTFGADTYKLRLMVGVDGTDYDEVGFHVSYTKNGTSVKKKLSSTTVYSNVDAEGTLYSAGVVFGDSAKYIMPALIYNIGKSFVEDNTTTFSVTPYWVTLDGTTVTGSEREITGEQIYQNVVA